MNYFLWPSLFFYQAENKVTAADIKLHTAVKTFSGNHKDRLPVLFNTWLNGTSYVIYSDVDGIYDVLFSTKPNVY